MRTGVVWKVVKLNNATLFLIFPIFCEFLSLGFSAFILFFSLKVCVYYVSGFWFISSSYSGFFLPFFSRSLWFPFSHFVFLSTKQQVRQLSAAILIVLPVSPLNKK